MLHMSNLLLCGLFSQFYKDSNRKYKFVMHLVDVYGPFAFFKGWYVVRRTPRDSSIL
jgi:fatty acyl-CoA reductase